MRRRRKRDEHEEHVDESWLIPYADLLTLLLALFIVLFSSSNLNLGKYQDVMSSFQSALGGGDSFLEGGNSIANLKPPSGGVLSPEEQEKEQKVQLDNLEVKLRNYIEEENLENIIYLEENSKGIMLSLRDVLLFGSGSAELKESSYKTLSDLIGLINTVDNAISIEGHTDNVPVNTSKYNSNWELSGARALTVLHFFASKNVERERLQFSGFADTKPLLPNSTPENKQANRRVDIYIIKKEF